VKLYLTPALRAKHNISDDLLGVVEDSKFRHAGCFPSIESLVTALDNEDDNNPVFKYDAWKHEVGPCTECGDYPDDGR